MIPSMSGAWEKFKRRGEAIERYNREHLESLTLEQAIKYVESLLYDNRWSPLPDTSTDPLPESIARLIVRSRHAVVETARVFQVTGTSLPHHAWST